MTKTALASPDDDPKPEVDLDELIEMAHPDFLGEPAKVTRRALVEVWAQAGFVEVKPEGA